MWHASAAATRGIVGSKTLRAIALSALEGVGDEALGQWEEWTGKAFHIRRRLRTEEQNSIGEAVDVRGTPEGKNRVRAAMICCPHVPMEMFLAEMHA